MKLFTVRLSDDERAKLEAHRVALGLRSHSDVVRHWINDPETPAEKARAMQTAARSALIELTGSALAYGPVSPPPGSRLKKR